MANDVVYACKHPCVFTLAYPFNVIHLMVCMSWRDRTFSAYLRQDLSMDTLVLVSPVLHASLYFTICSKEIVIDRILSVLTEVILVLKLIICRKLC